MELKRPQAALWRYGKYRRPQDTTRYRYMRAKDASGKNRKILGFLRRKI
jgi:hypothetical protein